MSLKTMLWVMEDAPVNNHAELAVLYALADRSNDDGTAAWPAQEWIAERARCSSRTVRRILQSLESDGVIRRGNQRLVEHIQGNRRPVVWDLNLTLNRKNQAGHSDLPTDPDVSQAGHGCPPGQEARGDIHDTQAGHSRHSGRTLLSYKPSINHPEPSKGVTEVGNVTDAHEKIDNNPPLEISDRVVADPRLARCASHAGVDSPPPCRACATERERAERVRDDRAAEAQQRSMSRRAAIDACELCDHNGLVAIDASGRVGRCPHDAAALAEIQERATADDADRASREQLHTDRPAPARRRWQKESAGRKQRRAAEAAKEAIEGTTGAGATPESEAL